MFLASPVLGTGFGSYDELFQRFTDQHAVMYFAHNDHAQLVAEGGIVALAVLVGVAVVLIGRFRRFCRDRQPGSRAVDAAAWAGLVAGAAHTVFDWNIHAMANACIFCILVGLALSSVVSRDQPARARRGIGWRLVKAALVASICGAIALLGRDAWQEGVMNRLRHAITSARVLPATASPRLQDLVIVELRGAMAEGERAEPYASGDWWLPILMGQASLHLAHLAPDANKTASPGGSFAERSFRKATLACPLARGFPEPVPRKKP